MQREKINPNRLANRVEAQLRQEQQYMDVVSISDWVVPRPEDPDYISPFQMQGCVFT